MAHITNTISPNGPVIDILIGVSVGREEALKRAGMEPPELIPGRALIDTGASCSCVEAQILTTLKLTPTGSVPIHTPSTGTNPEFKDLYDISLYIPISGMARKFQTIPVISSNLSGSGIDALIGRDILSGALLVYNGQTGLYTLAY